MGDGSALGGVLSLLGEASRSASSSSLSSISSGSSGATPAAFEISSRSRKGEATSDGPVEYEMVGLSRPASAISLPFRESGEPDRRSENGLCERRGDERLSRSGVKLDERDPLAGLGLESPCADRPAYETGGEVRPVYESDEREEGSLIALGERDGVEGYDLSEAAPGGTRDGEFTADDRSETLESRR
ncbi:hypothetical protein PYCC9005_005863 [Savitreella phatthalungensis]